MSIGMFYGRRQKKQRYQTQNELELTERLLGDVQVANTRFAEENELMENAWRIAIDDLTFKEVIGEGTFGRVFKGSWG